MSFFVVIPARYDSRRLPGKPLVDIAGIPMIQYVYESAKKSSAEDVIVATDDSRILEAVEKFGGKALLTSKDHRSGTERVQEVANQLDFSLNDIVVNVQGDEPLIPPAAIDIVAAALNEKKEFGIATLCETATEGIENPNRNHFSSKRYQETKQNDKNLNAYSSRKVEKRSTGMSTKTMLGDNFSNFSSRRNVIQGNL